MNARTVLFVTLALLIAVPALAQYQQPPRHQSWQFEQATHRLEILGYGGYLWSGSQDVLYLDQSGEIDFKDGAIWGIEADIAVRPGAQLVLLYQRQDTELEFRSRLQNLTVGDVAIEYWQIGGVSGVQRGNVMPFGLITLGGARIVSEFQGAQGDVWKFAILFGLGAKLYVSERIGFRVEGRLPWIITNGGGAVSCGTGGCYTSFGGSGIVQGDVSGGLFVMF